MTETATTRRYNYDSTTGKSGSRVTYLENVKVTPVMLADQSGNNAQQVNTVQGMPGVAYYHAETYTESHEHTKNSVTVTELPDIRENDEITIDSTVYIVRRAATDTLTSSFGQTLYVYLEESNRK